MSRLLELQEQVRDTAAAVAQFERAAAVDQSPSVFAGLRSVEKRLQRLETEFLEEAKRIGVDVCSYRVFSDSESRPAAASIFNTIGDFQNLFSTVFKSVIIGPKKKVGAPAPSVDESVFGFGYSFSGSVGIVLTFDNRQLLVESALDQTMDAVFELAKAQTSEQVLLASQQLGGPTIKAMHQWARDHIAAGFGADIAWLRGRETRGHLLMQLPEFTRLTEVLSEASESTSETLTLTGTLLGSDVGPPRRYHFRPDNESQDIRGSVAPGVISEIHPVTTPARYKVTLLREFKRIISTGEDRDEKHTLTALERID